MNTLTRNTSNLPATLMFEGAALRVVEYDGEWWFTSVDLSRALGYSNDQHVSRIYRDNRDEFTDCMTQVINGNAIKINQRPDSDLWVNPPVRARVFSLRGAHLVGIFARTAKAKAFRRWVLDVLEGLTPPTTKHPATTTPNESFATLIANPIAGPALSEIPSIMSACAQRLSGAMCLPHWQSAPAPSEIAEVVARSPALSRKQLDAIALAAIRRIMQERGSNGVQQILREVNGDYLLVNEPELVMSLYRARSLPQGSV